MCRSARKLDDRPAPFAEAGLSNFYPFNLRFWKRCAEQSA